MKYLLAFFLMLQTVNVMAMANDHGLDMHRAKERKNSCRHNGSSMRGYHKDLPQEYRAELLNIKEEYSIERLKLRNAEKKERMDLDTQRRTIREQLRSSKDDRSLQAQLIELDQKNFEIKMKYRREMFDLEEKFHQKALSVRKQALSK